MKELCMKIAEEMFGDVEYTDAMWAKVEAEAISRFSAACDHAYEKVRG